MIEQETQKTEQQEILVVEDTPASLQLLTGILTNQGYRVRPASNGRLALRSIDVELPDLILLDVKMPEMDGYEVCRRLKAEERSRQIPVIFISAFGDTAEKVEGFKAGGVDYITKPFEPEEVLARVRTHLRLRELTESLEQKVRERTDKLVATNQQLQREIGERKRAEEELRKSNKAYRALSECNQALIRVTDEAELLREVCRIIYEDCGYQLVWIGLAEHDKARTVRPVAQAGYEEGFLKTVNITWLDTNRGRGPTGVAIRTAKPVINRNILTNPDYAPWRAEATRHGYASSAAFPLITGEKEVIGALNVYAAEPDVFTTEETVLLMELASDLAYGIISLRTRAEHKRAEVALKESEEKFRTISTSALDAIIMMDNNGNISYWNKAAEKIFGYTKEEAIDKEIHIFLVPKNNHKGYENGFEKFRTTGKGPVIGKTLELSAIRKDGTEFPVELSVAAVKLKGKWNAIGTLRDITERKQAEEALRESEEKLNTLLNATTDVAFLAKSDGTFLAVNEALAKGKGKKKEELIGKNIFGFLPAEVAERSIAISQKIVESKKPLQWEDERAGRYFANSVYPILDNIGNVKQIALFAKDITERKQAEEEIQRNLQEKTILLNEIHHRVKNSLQVVASLLNLQSREIKDQTIVDLFTQSRKRIYMMSSVYETLYRTKDFSCIDFKEYLEDVLNKMYQASGMSHRVNFKMDVKNVVLGLDDAIPVALILNELFTNSIKYAFPENRKGAIEISFTLLDEDTHQLIYKDNGVGMPENIDFDTTETLGLTLVKLLANQIEGQATLKQNNWTTFKIEFKGYGYVRTKGSHR